MIAVSLVVADQDLPAGVSPGQYQVTMSTAGAPDVVQLNDGTSFEFQADAPATYSFSAQRLNTDGVPMTTPVTGTIDVPPPVPPAKFSAPVSISLQLA